MGNISHRITTHDDTLSPQAQKLLIRVADLCATPSSQFGLVMRSGNPVDHILLSCPAGSDNRLVHVKIKGRNNGDVVLTAIQDKDPSSEEVIDILKKESEFFEAAREIVLFFAQRPDDIFSYNLEAQEPK